jgi:intracellular septation protein A
MKLLFDFFPVVFFYISYNFFKTSHGEIKAMIIATAVLMAATVQLV